MQQGAQPAVMLTAYWQDFKAKLQTIYYQFYPTGIELSEAISISLPGLDNQAITALKEALPVKAAPGDTESSAKSEVDEDAIDKLFIKNLLIAMRLALIGEKVEDTQNPFTLKQLANELQNTPKYFGEKELPAINSEQTLAFAKLFYEHGQTFANGGVTSKSFAIKKGMETKVDHAKAQSQLLEKAIAAYQASTTPAAQTKKQISKFLAEYNWLAEFEKAFCEYILKYNSLVARKDEPNEQQSAPMLTWLWNGLAYPVSGWWQPALVANNQTELALEEANKPEELLWLTGKLVTFEKLITEMQQNVETAANISEFVVVPRPAEIKTNSQPSATGSEKVKLDPSLLYTHLALVLRHIHAYYKLVRDAVNGFESMDDFAAKYYVALDNAIEHLQMGLKSEQLRDYKAIANTLEGLCQYLPEPQSVKGNFESHFRHHFPQSSAEPEPEQLDMVDKVANKLRTALRIAKK